VVDRPGHGRPAGANLGWTTGFRTGELWLAYEVTGDEVFRRAAAQDVTSFADRIARAVDTDTHDLGFLYSLSCVAPWRLLGDRAARDAALKAADLLLLRYYEKAGIIQAWGNLADPAQRGRIIIDCAMNLPLLFWASETTGSPRYREAATRHLSAANSSLIRADWSTCHTYYFDTETGAPLRGVTAQGYSHDSCWARGQAWGIYGNALAYRRLGDKSLLEYSRGLARYFLNRLPEDLAAYWDLIFTSGPEERDSSASAIAACGLLELASHLPLLDPERRVFENAALAILRSLASRYAAPPEAPSCGLLLHGVYAKPDGKGVDEYTIFGDYFYLEALTRVCRDWNPYW